MEQGTKGGGRLSGAGNKGGWSGGGELGRLSQCMGSEGIGM